MHATAYEVYPVIRAVGPPEAPFEGRLANAPDGGVILRVDQDVFGDAGWALPPDPHVLAPLDVVRRPDGHDVILPVTPQRLDRVLARRREAHATLRGGEAVTIAVSIVRGAGVMASADVHQWPAAWWLSAEGRPLLVPGSGEIAGGAATAAVLADLAAACGDVPFADLLRDISSCLAEPRVFVRRTEEFEDALFSCAPPEPLAIEVLSLHRPRLDPPPAAEAGALRERRRPEHWWRGLLRAGDGELGDAASDLIEGVRRRAARAGSRRRPLLLATAAAAAVVTIGMAWPASPPDPAGASQETVESASTPVDASTPPAPHGEANASAAAIPALDALTALLDVRASCADEACRAQTQEDTTDQLTAAALNAPARVVTLLDDFGGLAVLRVEADGAPAQFVTVVDTTAGWRIRDAYDAADPSG